MPSHESTLPVTKAFLLPDEADHLVKVTDGESIYIVDAERVVWIRIGLPTKTHRGERGERRDKSA